MPNLSTLLSDGLLWYAHQSGLTKRPALPFGIKSIDSSLPYAGIPCGSLNEWRTRNNQIPFSFFAHFASQFIRCGDTNSEGRNIIWIGKDMRPNPHFLYQACGSRKIFDKSFFINVSSSQKKLWLLNETLNTKGIGLIFIELPSLAGPVLKRFSLLAFENGITLFIFRNSSIQKNYSVLSSWEVSPLPSESFEPAFNLHLSYYKGLGLDSKEWRVVFKEAKPEIINPEHINAQQTKNRSERFSIAS